MIQIRLDKGSPAGSVAFAYSPLLECLISLHVLVGPRDHALRHGWVRRMRSLDPKLRRRIDAFSFVYRRQIPDLFLPRAGTRPPVLEAELAGLERHPPDALRRGLGGAPFATCDRSIRERAIGRATEDDPASRELAELLVDDPPRFARRFGRLLADYWRAAFADEWRAVEPSLRAAVTEDRRLIARAGIWPMLARLPRDCRVDPLRLELHRECSEDRSVAVEPEMPLVLSPSAFIWPHTAVNVDTDWPLWLGYPAAASVREAVPELPPSELVGVLRALGDETRLRVLKAIAASPRTTQELAPLVGMSMAGLSKSLLRLADAGLVRGRREGRYVVYSLARGRIAAASPAVDRFLHDCEDGTSRTAA
jgi:DNA-binding transcriptional ArsR family regulator